MRIDRSKAIPVPKWFHSVYPKMSFNQMCIYHDYFYTNLLVTFGQFFSKAVLVVKHF